MGKILWVIFYFLVGFALIGGGIYIWISGAGNDLAYLIGGIILGLVVCYEGYTVIKPPKGK
ncbi:MAG: hypothetical protein WC924_02330 [Candidatus Gracilibacteria bacterium]